MNGDTNREGHHIDSGSCRRASGLRGTTPGAPIGREHDADSSMIGGTPIACWLGMPPHRVDRDHQGGPKRSADGEAPKRHCVLTSGGYTRVSRHRPQEVIRVNITTQSLEIDPMLTE